MSKHAASPESGAIAVEAHKTRRAALRALVGAGALAIPTIGAIAGARPDPILAAIERHKAAYEAALALSFAIDDVIYTPEREVSEAEWEALQRAHENENAAFEALLTAAPETCAGMRAVVAHLSFLDDGRLSPKVRQLLALLQKSRLLAG